jgi:hypothetical protein
MSKKERKKAGERLGIDITPTWIGVARTAIILFERGTPKGRKNAKEIVLDMGRKLDELNELAKKGKLKKVI